MRIHHIIIAAAAIIPATVAAGHYVAPSHEAKPARTYALVLELEQDGQRNAYVMDHGLSLSDCWQQAMDNKSNAKMTCEREF